MSTHTAHAVSSIKHLHFSERADPQLQGTAVYDEVRREAGSIAGLHRASCQHTGDRGRKPGQPASGLSELTWAAHGTAATTQPQ